MIIISIDAKKPGRVVRQIDQNLRAELPLIGRLKLKNVLDRIRVKMGAEGKKSTRPVKWDSDKQRRAFFATNGFGGGIPTSRTGKYIKGWQVVKKENGFGLMNRTKGAKYIGGNAYGLGQSRIHRGRWRLLRDATESEIEKLPAEMRSALFVVARRIAKETPA